MLSKVYCGKTWEPNYCLFARLGVGWRRGYRRWAPALKKKEPFALISLTPMLYLPPLLQPYLSACGFISTHPVFCLTALPFFNCSARNIPSPDTWTACSLWPCETTHATDLKFQFWNSFSFLPFFEKLFIWLHQVLVAACKLLVVACGI